MIKTNGNVGANFLSGSIESVVLYINMIKMTVYSSDAFICRGELKKERLEAIYSYLCAFHDYLEVGNFDVSSIVSMNLCFLGIIQEQKGAKQCPNFS